MSCPNCGTPAPDQATDCPTCGTKLVAAQAQPGWAPPGGGTAPPAWGGAPAPQPGSGIAPGAPQPGWGASPDAAPPAWGTAPDAVPPAWGATPPPQPGWGASPGAPQPGWGASPGAPQPGWGAPQGTPQQPQWGQPQWNNDAPGTSGQLAGWWRRVGATLIDGIILGIVYNIGKAVGGGVTGFLLYLVIGAVYTCVLLVRQGQTVGMMALGIKCVREAGGGLLSGGSALGRWALAAGLNATVIGGLLDILWPLWDAKNQTLHDKAVGSLVVRTR